MFTLTVKNSLYNKSSPTLCLIIGISSGRQILDGFLVANEIVNYAMKETLKLLLLKVDFEKAFDSVNWSFLLDIMSQMGFSPKWCKWILACLSSASILVHINGSTTKEFTMERGLRQGDPLSPFLFSLSQKHYRGWSKLNMIHLLHILNCFHDVSGLKINLLKSRLFGIGVFEEEVVNVARAVNCSNDSLPFSYLGLPIRRNLNKIDAWSNVVQKFIKRLSSWKANLLSIGGRLTLVKSVLGPDGGFNSNGVAALKKGPWKNIVDCCLNFKQLDPSFSNLMVKKIYSGNKTSFWYDNWISECGPLRCCFPRLFALEAYKYCLVSDRWVFVDGFWQANWAWNRQTSSKSDGEVSSLLNLLNGLVLSPSQDDRWIWSLEHSGVFSVRSLSATIDKKILDCQTNTVDKVFSWNSWVPRKVNICTWRVFLDRLPTRSNLSRHGIQIYNPSCVFCDDNVETRDHCFYTCPKIKIIWLKIWSWWKAPPTFHPSLDDILTGGSYFSIDKRKSKIFHAVCMTFIWYIWAWRNKIIHATTIEEANSARYEDVFLAVQRQSLLWISNRAPSRLSSWISWIHHPYADATS
ncbi:RNA-directed DNA polymerase, eukaryota, reverse transcriptase zinc-binding domain protein [Tanacetum coccineum]|uniref:RNA-directed DNA polymerase, eukaryota, reverse transcriptase zinc-binding domain protein n=1 Tax=Tanacetum coccineum TaxID=301880 RepID=A0ABQ4ZG59_9ASTR